jgi:rod shape-determining protein MreD
VRALSLVGLALLALTLQTTLLAGLEPFCPDFAVVLVVYIALTWQKGVRRGAILAFLLGYAEDLFLGHPQVGLRAFCLTVIFLAVRPMQDRIRLDGALPLATVSFFSALFGSLVETLLRRVFVASFSISAAYAGGIFLAAFATSIAAPLLIRLVQRLSKGSPSKGEESIFVRSRKGVL